MERKLRIDLTGQKFGRLTVLHVAGRTKRKEVLWYCVCECGCFTKVMTRNLRSGITKSCGCLRLERVKASVALPKGEACFNQLLLQYKRHARNRELKFKLTKEQFKKLTSSDCYYCGEPPSQIRKGERHNGVYVYNGIDRIDNKGNYTINNCVSACGKCNWMKQTLSQETFLAQVAKIYINVRFGVRHENKHRS